MMCGEGGVCLGVIDEDRLGLSRWVVLCLVLLLVWSRVCVFWLFVFCVGVVFRLCFVFLFLASVVAVVF